MTEKLNAEVISVYPDKVKISVDDLEQFKIAEDHLKVGSYLRVSDTNDVVLIAIVDSFCIEAKENGDRKYILEASPLGTIEDGDFVRGGDSIVIPPKTVEPAKKSEISQIYASGLKEKQRFEFSNLSNGDDVKVPVDCDKFFNKHIAVVGSTGSGKSNTIATVVQKATSEKSVNYDGLNNSHVIIFDIHAEYKSAFPIANNLTIDDLILPYWLLNSEELEELFLDAGDHNNYRKL